MKHIIFLLSGCFFFQVSIAQPTTTMGLFFNSSEAYNGYTLFAPMASTHTYLIDNCGYVIQDWQSNYLPGLSVQLLENGYLLRACRLTNSTFYGGGSGGRVELLDWDSNVVWSYHYSSAEHHQHHDISYLPNGNILLLAWEYKSLEEAEAMGRQQSIPTSMWPDHIIELAPIGTDDAAIVWEWHVWDHLIQDVDPSKPNYGIVAEHPERININFDNLGIFTGSDWMHSNAIDYNAELDQIMISVHHFSEIWLIDHSTTSEEAASSSGGNSGKGGDLLYRWGNPDAYNRFDGSNRTLYTQHDAQWIPDNCPDAGKIMVFNNGVNRPEGNYSSIDVIDPPLDITGDYIIPENTAIGPNDLFWTYHDDTAFFSDFISSAQRLPTGTTLICEGDDGRFFEVDNTGNVVWEYISPVSSFGSLSQGQNPNGNMVFKVSRYPSNYIGLTEQDLNPGSPLEFNPNDYDCSYYNSVICATNFTGKVWLQGCYNSSNNLMNTTLFDNNILPANQPFNQAPWHYNGTESIDLSSPTLSNLVDWLLLEVRSPSDSTVILSRQAILVVADGTLIDITGNSAICLVDLTENESYYFALRSRNHIDVISRNLLNIPSTTIFDFSHPLNIVGSISQLSNLGDNTYALLAGDLDGNGIISVNDYNWYFNESSLLNGYYNSDLNFDGALSLADFNYYNANASTIGSPAIRY